MTLMALWIQKLSTELCIFHIQVLVLTNVFFSIKLCFYQRGIQPSIAYIFLDTGKRIADVEKQAYEYYVIFFENIGIVQT